MTAGRGGRPGGDRAPRARSRSRRSSTSRCTTPTAASTPPADRRAAAATSSPAPRSVPLFGAVVARALDALVGGGRPPGRVDGGRGGRRPGHAGPQQSSPRRRRARRPCATCSSSAPPRSGACTPRTCRSRSRRQPSPSSAGRRGRRAARTDPPTGPIVVSLGELPRLPGPCVVLANELLDNLPFGLLERTPDGWAEVHVGVDGDRLVEVLVPTDGLAARRRRSGSRVPRAGRRGRLGARRRRRWPGRAGAWSPSTTPSTTARAGARDRGRSGCAPTAATPAAEPPLEALGTQDITCEVAVDQLPPPSSDRVAGRLAARPRHRRAGRGGPRASGTSGPPSATSPPCGPAAGSPRPRRSSIPPASGASACPRVDRALTHSGNIPRRGSSV